MKVALLTRNERGRKVVETITLEDAENLLQSGKAVKLKTKLYQLKEGVKHKMLQPESPDTGYQTKDMIPDASSPRKRGRKPKIMRHDDGND